MSGRGHTCLALHADEARALAHREVGGVVQRGLVRHRGEGGGAVAASHDLVYEAGIQTIGQTVGESGVLKNTLHINTLYFKTISYLVIIKWLELVVSIAHSLSWITKEFNRVLIHHSSRSLHGY